MPFACTHYMHDQIKASELCELVCQFPMGASHPKKNCHKILLKSTQRCQFSSFADGKYGRVKDNFTIVSNKGIFTTDDKVTN